MHSNLTWIWGGSMEYLQRQINLPSFCYQHYNHFQWCVIQNTKGGSTHRSEDVMQESEGRFAQQLFSQGRLLDQLSQGVLRLLDHLGFDFVTPFLSHGSATNRCPTLKPRNYVDTKWETSFPADFTFLLSSQLTLRNAELSARAQTSLPVMAAS